MKKTLTYLMVAAVLVSSCAMDMMDSDISRTYDEYGKEVCWLDFADTCLRRCFEEAVGVARDGLFPVEGIATLTKLDCSGRGIVSLGGSQNFPNLDTLICDNNKLESIDFNLIPSVRHLSCAGNRISEMNLCGANLQSLRCSPMNDEKGRNLLKYIYLYRDQDIPDLIVPDETFIIELPRAE